MLFSDFLENKLIDWLFRGQAFGVTGASAGAGSGPTTLWLALFTTIPSDANVGGVEVSGGSYARISIASSLANWAGTQSAGSIVASTGASGTTSNNVALAFVAPTANWGTIKGFGLYDASTGGNLIVIGTLTADAVVNSGDGVQTFTPSSLILQVDN